MTWKKFLIYKKRKDKLVFDTIMYGVCVIVQKFTFMMWILNYTE